MRVPLSRCSATIVTPGSTPPCVSRTTPEISPVSVCAAAGCTSTASRTAANTKRMSLSILERAARYTGEWVGYEEVVMHRWLALILSVLPASAFAQAAMPADYQAVLATLGKMGDFKENVLRVNIPRNDLHVVIDGVATPTPFGFGGWLALTKGTGGMDVMMGDLVLTEDEVNPVMSALLTNGLDVTALHNHFFGDTPRIFYMHVHGHGNASDLATKVKPALALIGARQSTSARPASQGAVGTSGRAINGTLDGASLAKIVGYDGEQNGGVYKITIGRADIPLKEMGASINSRMGLNTWAAFYGSDSD